MLVCHCHEVGDRTLRKCIREGAQTISEIGAACGAGTSCGGCRPAIQDLISALVLPRMVERFECVEQDTSVGATP
ncbi:MAG TPA: (2Fe-2S)-binding protein [Polyangia bacterium]